MVTPADGLTCGMDGPAIPQDQRAPPHGGLHPLTATLLEPPQLVKGELGVALSSYGFEGEVRMLAEEVVVDLVASAQISETVIMKLRLFQADGGLERDGVVGVAPSIGVHPSMTTRGRGQFERRGK